MLGRSDPREDPAGNGFDDLALLADTGLSRRQVLKRAAGLALASLIPPWMSGAKAKAPGNPAGTGTPASKYGWCPKPAPGVCEGSLTMWTPQCTAPVASGTPSPHNGCGPQGGVNIWGINVGDIKAADKPLGLASFTQPCNDHDCCYGTCGKNKATCDVEALNGWLQACNRQLGNSPDDIIATARLGYCYGAAWAYYEQLDSEEGIAAFNEAQGEACNCCAPGEPCGGKVCPPGEQCCQDSICFNPEAYRCCNLRVPGLCPTHTLGGHLLCLTQPGSDYVQCAYDAGFPNGTCSEFLSVNPEYDGCS